jgi:hypothetical protein
MRLITLVVLLASFGFAQTQVAPPPKPRGVMVEANSEIVKLLQAKFSETVILNKIHATKTPFDTSADAILALKKAGANENEINAILTLETNAAPSPTEPNPPAAAPPQGPTLEETLNFVAEQVTQQGSLIFNVYDRERDNRVATQSTAYSNIHPESAKCALSWTMQTGYDLHMGDGLESHSTNYVLNLNTVKSVQAQSFQDKDNQAGINVSMVPPVFLVVLNNSDIPIFFFTDANRADRVAQAITHAAELCGATKDPF